MQTTTVDVQYNTGEHCSKTTTIERLGYLSAITLNLALGIIFIILD